MVEKILNILLENVNDDLEMLRPVFQSVSDR